jgi:hypothetical protein
LVRIAQERDAAGGDIVGRAAEFDARQGSRQGIEIDESISMQSDASLRAKHTRNRSIDSVERKPSRFYRLL